MDLMISGNTGLIALHGCPCAKTKVYGEWLSAVRDGAVSWSLPPNLPVGAFTVGPGTGDH